MNADRPIPPPEPNVDQAAPDAGDDARADIPPEALEEARRWADVPMDEPEESTGVDV